MQNISTLKIRALISQINTKLKYYIMNSDLLTAVKTQEWFYEFMLPDGSRTNSYLPDFVRQIHHTREKALLQFLNIYAKSGAFKAALDVSCHEAYYTHVLANKFEHVTGIDKNESSLSKAKLITEALVKKNISFVHSAVENWKNEAPYDFVLCFGLLYHIENPVEMMRKLSALSKTAICIESQILPAETQMLVEDGSYKKLREIEGSFGLCMDYPEISEGGLTELALVPSRKALYTLLEHFGFVNIKEYVPEENDYEQFVRQQRIIIYAEKQTSL